MGVLSVGAHLKGSDAQVGRKKIEVRRQCLILISMNLKQE